MNKAQQLLASIKAAFAAAEKEEKFMDYTLDNGTVISVDKMEVGGMATQNGAPVAAGSYTLNDKTIITCDATGMITAVTPFTEDPSADLTTPEGMRKAYDKFATGTPEDRLNNLETLCKALMEYSFGWQLRETQAKQTTDAAIAVYKNLVDGQQATVTQQAKMMKQMFELMQEIVQAPAADIPGEGGKKKFSFANVEGRKKTLEKFQAAAKVINEQHMKAAV